MDNIQDESFKKFLSKVTNQSNLATPDFTVKAETTSRNNNVKNDISIELLKSIKSLEKSIKGTSNFNVKRRLDNEEETTKGFGNLGDLFKGIKERLKETYDFYTNKNVKRTESATRLLPKNDAVGGKTAATLLSTGMNPEINPEADNIISSQEIVADSSKQIVEILNKQLEIQNYQLVELKGIKEALVPKVPPELTEGSTNQKKRMGQGGGESSDEYGDGGDNIFIDVDGKKDKRGKKGKGKGPSKPTGKMGGFGKWLGGAGILGGALAVGAGAYTAYEGLTGAEEEKQQELQAVEQAVKSGEITPQQAEAKKKEIDVATTEKKGGVVGEGTGMAAGAIGGMKAGAALGTMIGGPVGTFVGGAAGGALGAFAGSKVGKSIGEFGGKIWSGIKGAPESISKYNEAFKDVDKDKGFKPVERLEGTTAAEMINTGVWEGYSPDMVASPSVEKTISRIGSNVQSNEPILGKQHLISKGIVTNREQLDNLVQEKLKSYPDSMRNNPEVLKNLREESAIELKSRPVSEVSRYNDTSTQAKESQKLGLDVNAASVENSDLQRDIGRTPSQSPVVSNNVVNNNSTTYMPSKATPRPEFTGSALDRYQSRVAVY